MPAAQRIHDGTEHEQQDQRAILILVQIANASLVPRAARQVQTLQERQHPFQVLDPQHIALGRK